MLPVMVGSKQDMDMHINNYKAQGYFVSQQSQSSTILSKKKKFNWGIALVLMFTGFGIILYAGYYFLIAKDETVCINLNQMSAAS